MLRRSTGVMAAVVIGVLGQSLFVESVDIEGGIAQNYTTGLNGYWTADSRVQFH
ncbi:MAG: hypothetical protein MK538_06335 [Planctomycetes bacterium]|nr:hypothetical protein [Planctomycetota bacterium]